LAIKGKGRTRTRQSVRAPRRGPVPVPVPVARRRGVQVTAAFVAGLLLFWGGVWLTNGLREQDRAEQEAAADRTRRQAGSTWSTFVEGQIQTVGTIQPGTPPVILPQVGATVDELGKAKETPKGSVRTLRDAADAATKAADTIEEFDLAGTIRNKGFDQAAVLQFLGAQDELGASLRLFREAALVAASAAELTGEPREALLQDATALLGLAAAAADRFQQHQGQALFAAGFVQTPQLPGS
jgi:hypothetical protein